MGGVGCGCAATAALLAVITAFPLLGWANWLFTIPVAFVAIAVSLVGLSRGEQSGLAIGGLVVGALVLFWALFRLALGGGIV